MYKTKLNKILNIIEKFKNDITLPIISDFLEWFYEKINLNFNRKNVNKFLKKWEIWISKLWLNIWSEQNWEIESNYTRPVLVIKSFWVKNDHIIVLPLTKYKKPEYISFLIEKKIYDFLKYDESFILLDQIKTISKKRLIWNPIWSISNKDFVLLQNKLNNLLFNEKIEKP